MLIRLNKIFFHILLLNILLQINKLEKEVEEKTRLFRILEAFLDVVENILKDKVRLAQHRCTEPFSGTVQSLCGPL